MKEFKKIIFVFLLPIFIPLLFIVLTISGIVLAIIPVSWNLIKEMIQKELNK